MSLANLKKKQPTARLKKLTVEDFIEDAQAYARGESVLGQLAAQAIKVRVKRNKSTRTKHATFSLSENCISQLANLAQRTGISKSKLVRMLVNIAKDEQQGYWKNIPDPDNKG